MPFPADFGDRVPGIGFVDGRFVTLDEDARRAAAAAVTEVTDEDSAATMQGANRGLAAANWLQRYENRLAAPSLDNPDRFSVGVLLVCYRICLPGGCRIGVCDAHAR